MSKVPHVPTDTRASVVINTQICKKIQELFFSGTFFLSIENFSLLLLKVEGKKFLIFVKTFLVLTDTKNLDTTTHYCQNHFFFLVQNSILVR